MKITHHPDIATLMCCAAGSQPEAFAAVVASHLSVCPACREEVRRMQEIGVALFDKLDPVPVACQPSVVAMRAGEADVEVVLPPFDREETERICKTGMPPPLAKHVGCCLDEVAWRPVAEGIWAFTIPLSQGCCGRLELIKIAPGVALPEHGHQGAELTLVLRGSYTDEVGTFRPGDVADLDEEATHKPVACPEKGCICLMAGHGDVRFDG